MTPNPTRSLGGFASEPSARPESPDAGRHDCLSGRSPAWCFPKPAVQVEAVDVGARADGVRADEDVVGSSRVRELEVRVRDLERLLGRKTLEVEGLKEALAATLGKNRTGSCRRSHPGVSRPTILVSLAPTSSSRCRGQ